MADLLIPPMPLGGERFGAWWDEDAAQKACAFFPAMLRHTEAEWAGRPFHLRDWQRDRIIRVIFGWKRADGTRLVRIVWLEVPRKNGKTELAAGIALLMMFVDQEMGGQIFSMASDKDQAKIVFNKAGVMASFNEAMSQSLELFKTSIFCPALMTHFRPLSAGPQGKHGLSPTAAIGDEVHEWRDGDIADVVHKGTAARRQPLEVYITTAGVRGVGYAAEMHELAMDIVTGKVIDPTMLPVIFAAEDGDDWKSEDTWRKANPNYGISVKPEYMREEFEKAVRSPRAENDFKRFHLNIWTEQVTRWLPMEDWHQGAGPVPWQDLHKHVQGRRCFGGIDLSIVSDASSLCWCFPPPAEDPDAPFIFIWRFWLPEGAVENQPRERRARYDSFVRSGALSLTPGRVVDNDFIRARVNEDADLFKPEWIGIDPYNASDMSHRLMDQDGLPIQYFRQGFLSMSAPTKGFERMVIGHGVQHGGHPVATWMARNAVVATDAAGNIKPEKSKAADKIDGIVAAIMAYGGASVTPEEKPLEVRTVNGILVIG
jgi:phage terminase large subunit-like protein